MIRPNHALELAAPSLTLVPPQLSAQSLARPPQRCIMARRSHNGTELRVG